MVEVACELGEWGLPFQGLTECCIGIPAWLPIYRLLSREVYWEYRAGLLVLRPKPDFMEGFQTFEEGGWGPV